MSYKYYNAFPHSVYPHEPCRKYHQPMFYKNLTEWWNETHVKEYTSSPTEQQYKNINSIGTGCILNFLTYENTIFTTSLSQVYQIMYFQMAGFLFKNFFHLYFIFAYHHQCRMGVSKECVNDDKDFY